MKMWLTLFVLLALNVRCASPVKSSEVAKRKAARYLEQDYASYRSSFINNVKYSLTFDLTEQKAFSGKSKITFNAKEPKDLTIDFFDGTVTGLVVNSKNIQPEYNGFFVSIPKELLRQGENTVAISFTHGYSSSGSGLYRFVDPEDKKVYLYSDFEPYDAHLMFPCFDQPDLKATFQTHVRAPQDWIVVSSTKESAVDKRNGIAEWTFPESGIFSTYIYALHAGEYKIWTAEAKTKNHTIPLRLLARQSLAKYVIPQEWFTTTAQGFRFFEDYFGYPYAYQKYDQLIVPDFNSGAMENVAAVTFNEWTVSRTSKERAQRRGLASIILHEMAHMWFGNLVTMKWWNDLWLNESFATFASVKALVGATEFRESWTNFHLGSKRGAYFEDQAVTTHPIEFTVPNTDVVFANFDGITYGKGASVLKQLDFWVGNENFKKGLKQYFAKNAFKNTTLADFMDAIGQASGKSLTEWQKTWLQIPQVNTVALSYQCVNGKFEQSHVIQSSVKKHPTLRSHKSKVAVYSFKENAPKKIKDFEIEFSEGKTKVPQMDGLTCGPGTLVYANYGDYDYAKIELDPISIETAKKHLVKVPDDLVRSGLWGALWEMVRDQKLSATEFFAIALRHTEGEKNIDIASNTIDRAKKVLDDYLPEDERGKLVYNQLHNQFVEFLLKGARAATSIDVQKRWFDFYVASLRTPSELVQLKGLLVEKPQWLKFPLDQDRRWTLLNILSSFAIKDYELLLENELKRDSSKRGEDSYRSAKASVPKLEVKKEKWEQIIKGPQQSLSLAQLKPIVSALFPRHQDNFRKMFGDAFFSQLGQESFIRNQPPEFLPAFASLSPRFCTTESAQKINSFVADHERLPPVVVKQLRIDAEEDDRCAKIRAKVIETI